MSDPSIKLKVLGRVDREILSELEKVLDLKNNANEIVLFCDYSMFDIPIGYKFKKIYNSNKKCIYNGEIILDKVTQNHALPFELVPYGYKTICKFIFPESEIPVDLFKYEAIRDWYESKATIIFDS